MRNIQTPFLVLLAGLVIALGTGCSSEKTWVYRANTYSAPAVTSAKTVAVRPFDDMRVNENNNLWGLYALPLMPFGWQTLNTPEGVQMHTTSGMWLNFKPTEDFPKALAEDLRNTHLFTDAYFDYRSEAGDYAVNGKILSTKYTGRIISYCLGFYGPDLWLIGLPSCWTQNELSLQLSLVDSKTKKELFTKIYTADPQSHLAWLYYISSDFNYAEMLQDLNKQFCDDIQPIIAAQPAAPIATPAAPAATPAAQ